MNTKIITLQKPKLQNPILVVGLPGIGNVGRVAAGYLVAELKMKKFAELYSPHFLPLVVLYPNGSVHLLKCEFYHYKTKNRDIVVLLGDTQAIDNQGQYEISQTIVEYAKSIGIQEIITLGGFAETRLVTKSKVIGAVSDQELVQKYEKYGIDFGKEHASGTIMGTSGLLIGLAPLYGIRGLCLMGQTGGLPILTDPKAAEKVLEILIKILNIKLDLTKLEQAIKEMEERLKHAEKIQKQMIKQLKTPKEEIRYIG